jgi:hypothetical protein
VSSLALVKSGQWACGTGLLTCGVPLPVAPSHPVLEQWHRATGKFPLTVAGQWRILTALPVHSTSVGDTACDRMETNLPSISPEEIRYSCGQNYFDRDRTPERQRNPLLELHGMPPWIADAGNRHRPSFEADSNWGGPCRSPGLRFNGSKLPSQRSHASGILCFSPHRLQWRGRAGFSPASQTIQSLDSYTAAFRNQSRTSEPGPGWSSVKNNLIPWGIQRS